MIPVYDETYTHINMEGRAVISSDLKCLYPRLAIKPIFEWYKLDTNKPLYLFEGLIKMAVARQDPTFANSSTTMGCFISDFQWKQLHKFKSITLVRDYDEPGRLMAVKMKDIFKGQFSVKHTTQGIKDVDEIPTELSMTMSEYMTRYDLANDVEFI
jgi:hypothetical protein